MRPPSSAIRPRRCPRARRPCPRRKARATRPGLSRAPAGRRGARLPAQPFPKSPMSLFASSAFEDHEAVHAFADKESGLRAIIAIHSTARGPAAGGCRMYPYPDDQAALDDALRLSRAISHKNAMADIDLGG